MGVGDDGESDMTRFDQCLAFVLKMEGGFVNDPLDRGGATNKGIAQASYDAYHDKISTPRQSVKFITDDEVKVIYAKNYWVPELPIPLDLCVFDAAVQHGLGRAARWLQKCLNVTVDGSIGQGTMKALNAVKDVPALVESYMAMRQAFYDMIIQNDSTQERFRRGWMSRLQLLRQTFQS